MPAFIAKALKAWVAGLIAFGGSLSTVLVGDAKIGDVSDGQWLTASLVGLLALATVYGVTNTPPTPPSP